MGTKKFYSVGDLSRFGANFWVKCRHCQHEAWLTPAMLGWYCGDARVGATGRAPRWRSKQLADIAARLRCTCCGRREVDWEPQNRD